MENKVTGKKWHVASWPMLAWVETLIKLSALGVAIVAAVNVLPRGSFQAPTDITLVQFIILAILSLGLLAAIYDRFIEREIIAMAFVVLNNLGHWGLTVALLTNPKPSQALLTFCTLMLVGDLVKIAFLRAHDFAVRDIPKTVLYGLIAVYIVGYLALVLLEFAI